ncbi:MAG TPA: cupin domain-containing protein [Terriglobales bacterium]|nr:cupin domain-containing protein [Terriglobales bacterium]
MKGFRCLPLRFLIATCNATAPSVPELRMTPTEIMSGDKGDSQIGSSKLAGVHTKILAGNPSAAGFYSILLFVPPRTTIQARSHRDDRMATVVSGTWHFGYGTHFDEKALKTLWAASIQSPEGAIISRAPPKSPWSYTSPVLVLPTRAISTPQTTQRNRSR